VRYRSSNRNIVKPVLFIAHMDVVTANPSEWLRDPFTLIEEDGYFFGRGTADIKSEIVAITTAFMRLRREGFVPNRDLIIAFTGDEETSQATTRDLVDKHRALIDADYALNGDGGGGTFAEGSGAAQLFYLQGAEKSYATFEIVARNAGGHSSQPRADNAIYALADALKALQAHRFPVLSNEWTLGSFAVAGPATGGELGAAMSRFAANPADATASDRLAREHAYVGRTRTTCVATMLKGGHAENALAQTAAATVNCRIFPGTRWEDVRMELQRVVGDEVEVKQAGRAFDSIASPMRADVRGAVTKALHSVYPGVKVVPDQASYYTDGSVLRAAGIPTYGVSGLFSKDSDNFSHGLNERIEVRAFYNSVTYWDRLIRDVGSSR
jgi:acetylornithine deacetylase/succinyl-diaminopimelate desuccinylase-like protein